MHRNLLNFLAAAYLVNFEYNSTTTTPGFVVVFFFLSKSLGGQDDHNMDIYHQVKHKLQVPQTVKKVISHWLLCGADGTCKVT